MREYKIEEVVVTEQKRVLTSITCNCCGVTEERRVNVEYDYGYDDTMISFSTSFGYGSSFVNESWSFDLCESCFVSIVKTFRVVPDGFAQDSYRVHDPQKTFEEWVETGVIDIEAGMTAEELAEQGGSIYADEDGD